ncbi:hypothetical protein KI387_022287, partial [Taxus chinensis]
EGKRNFRPDHLSWIKYGEDVQNIEYIMLDAQQFILNCALDDLEDIIVFLCTGLVPEGMKTLENSRLFLQGYRESDYVGSVDDRKSTIGYIVHL